MGLISFLLVVLWLGCEAQQPHAAGLVLPCTVRGQCSGKLQEAGIRTVISLEQQVRMQVEPSGEFWVPPFSGELRVLWGGCFKGVKERARGVVWPELSAGAAHHDTWGWASPAAHCCKGSEAAAIVLRAP